MNKQGSRSRRIIRVIIFLLAAVTLTLFFLDDVRRDLTDPPAARLLPDLPAYRQVEGQTLTSYIGALSEGAALVAGQPQLAVTVGVVDQAIDCYQEVGAVRARLYSHGERPLEAGLVAIVDDARINDPSNLFRCVAPATLDLEGSDEPVLEPCTAAFTLVREGHTFHVIYAGSTYSVCRDFCSSIEGCQVHAESQPANLTIAVSRQAAIMHRFAPGQ
ncbi:MAG: hypothetical protein KC410_09775 [Anaerolineales bacterium]|uniref:hypothetical protein n=1 Tax=Promineifilum sp. TaxID=2664178 RepID=UPI001D28AF54|nr:hypothetical protein [Anaerolineales bacterium]MCB8935162.1 hypothetical protein [Promineifilum sp.]MCO5179107.1 hypothetical protein [Promineifilum sp.]